LAKLSSKELQDLQYLWRFWARPNQLHPTHREWTYWLVQAGRGFGKTRTGAEWVRQRVRRSPFVSLIAATAADARDVMIEGESGILRCCPKDERPEYEPSNRRLVWPNGARSSIFSADEPDRLRGPQHSDIWADELAAWRYPEAWDQALFGLRLGADPRACITTTPRPTKLVKSIIADPATVVTRGTTRENAHHLAPAFLRQIVGKYVGTRLGRQELDGEVLDDNPGALWQRLQIDALRAAVCPQLQRVVIAIDPSGGDDPEKNDEVGMIAAGVDERGHGYVFNDLSGLMLPAEWARTAVTAFHANQADRVVAEVNYGGAMVEATIRSVDDSVPYKAVSASRGKMIRAEPVSALYEQGRVHHVGFFAKLEDEMCEYDGKGKSPNRLDALVWALTELMLGANNTALLDWMRMGDGASQVSAAVVPRETRHGVNIFHGDE
jgi:phage terminase large subunit-like protein